MTPHEAERMLKVVEDVPGTPEDGDELTLLEARYCEELVFGPHNGVQWKAYSAASGVPGMDQCSSPSSDLMKLPRVKRYLWELEQQRRAQRRLAYEGPAKPWPELARLGMKVIEDVILGLTVTGKQLEAAIYAINRVEGLPTATVDLNVQNHERIAGATKMFTRRIAEERKKKSA